MKTREEQIQIAALNYTINAHGADERDDVLEIIADDFIAGANFAYANPNWHKYPDEKPNKSDEYIVAFDSGNVYTAHYSTRFNKWVDPDGAFNLKDSKVIAWMEFPKLPKLD